MQLSQTDLKELLQYDPVTGEFFWKKNTSSRNLVGKPAGYTKGYVFIRIQKKLHYAHRLAFLYMTGAFPKENVDHINGIRSDNRWINLRNASAQINKKNCAKYRNNTSGAFGVTWDARKNMWLVRVMVNYKSLHIGYFDTIEEAAQARKEAEMLHGFHSNHGRT